MAVAEGAGLGLVGLVLVVLPILGGCIKWIVGRIDRRDDLGIARLTAWANAQKVGSETQCTLLQQIAMQRGLGVRVPPSEVGQIIEAFELEGLDVLQAYDAHREHVMWQPDERAFAPRQGKHLRIEAFGYLLGYLLFGTVSMYLWQAGARAESSSGGTAITLAEGIWIVGLLLAAIGLLVTCFNTFSAVRFLRRHRSKRAPTS